MKNLKNQKGITLVALVVTIIVLLILAGVSLSLVAGSDGILGRATNAVDKNQIAMIKEKIELKVAEEVENFYEAKYVNREIDNATTALMFISGQDTENEWISEDASKKKIDRWHFVDAGGVYEIVFDNSINVDTSNCNFYVNYEKGKTRLTGKGRDSENPSSTVKIKLEGATKEETFNFSSDLGGTVNSNGSLNWGATALTTNP